MTTPRAAAVAGILFAVLMITSLVLMRLSIPANPQDAVGWAPESWDSVTLALNLVPFAGIAFLWFIGVVRDQLGQSEDRFFATVFLGSGLLFLAMMFDSAAVAGGTIKLFQVSSKQIIESGVYMFGRNVTYETMNVYSLKMAGVFMLTSCTLFLRTGILPRWIVFLGFFLAAVLLLSLGIFDWAPLVFPLWILLVSVYILQANLRRSKNQDANLTA